MFQFDICHNPDKKIKQYKVNCAILNVDYFYDIWFMFQFDISHIPDKKLKQYTVNCAIYNIDYFDDIWLIILQSYHFYQQ